MAESAINFFIKELSNLKNFINFKNLDENLEVLNQTIELLNSKKADVLTILQGKLISGKKRKREVENWLNNVDQKTRLFEVLVQEIEQTRNYNVIGRGRLAKQVIHEIGELAALVEQGRFPEGIVLDATVKESVPPVTFRAKGIAFEQNLEKICTWLMDDKVSSIGICGIGGVGKTRLAKHIHDQLLHEDKFSNCVYWVTVSGQSNTFMLQDKIAKAMNIEISHENDENRRAHILLQTLAKRKKIVVIMDDVWEQFDLEKIGLPLRRNGCQVLVTSRSADVCHRIGCQKILEVKTLSRLEAWELFREELGDTLLYLKIEKIAQEASRMCDGLPLAIITVARSLRGVTDIHEWKDALAELIQCSINNMGCPVDPILLYSFKQLGNQKLEQCFLYCSLYPEDYEIRRDELINMFILEELMDRRSSREAEFDQGHAILNKLENRYLLLRSQHPGGKQYVKMHDVMREMALWITRDNPRFMVKAGLQLMEIPPEREWKEELNKISLMWNEIKYIPAGTSPKCPSLSTLNLSWNPLRVIPESFFVHMSCLKSLDLSYTSIVHLPNSIMHLTNLRGLLLGHCNKLVSLPSLEKLIELSDIDLSHTNIKKVIHGMASLTNLKCLNLYSVSLEMIPPGTLQRLSHLQRLILPDGVSVAVQEVEGLRHLEEFQGTFNSVCDLNRFIESCHYHGKLSSYDIDVGRMSYFSRDSGSRLTCKRTSLRKCDPKESWREDEIILPRDIESLSMESCEDVEYIMRLSLGEELMEKTILLENLKYLRLNKLPNLLGIMKLELGAVRVPTSGTFPHLRKLEISNCKSIKTLLPRGLVDNLQNLEYLKVSACVQMEEIIGGEDVGIHSNTNVTLPLLTYLVLHDLPKLKSISMSTTICDSIKTISIKSCSKLKKIPLFRRQQYAPPALKQIIVLQREKEWWDSLEWDHFDIRNAVQPFIKFEFIDSD